VTQTLRRPPAWSRAARALRVASASIALFALLGIGHILPAFHFALVAHRVCSEHGELLHEAAPPARAAARSRDVSLVAGEEAAHEHEHCGVLALPGSLAVPVSSAATFELVSSDAAAGSPGRASSAHVGIALLSYAPKLAPPA
jgi:hypothetical protein